MTDKIDFKTLTGPQLVHAYNGMVEEVTKLGSTAYREVARFASTEAGVARCEKIASTLRALHAGQAEEKKRGARSPQPHHSIKKVTWETQAEPATPPEPQQENDMAAKKAGKAKAPKAAKLAKEPKVAKEPKAKKADKPEAERLATGKIAELFEVRAGSYRDRMLAAFIERFGKPVATSDLQKALYGRVDAEDVGAMKMVMKGILTIIAAKDLPYEIEKGKLPAESGRGELTFTLARKG